jgi:hypothetical protein
MPGMRTLKQIQANRLNALKSTGPRSSEGKQRSRLNAVQDGLTAETVIGAFENAADYEAFEQSILADYSPRTATERELVARLASVLWRLRRSTSIETGLLQIQAELMQSREAPVLRRNARQPEWYDELDLAQSRNLPLLAPVEVNETGEQSAKTSQELAYCFLQVSRLQYGAFDTLTRYETALWRQAAQLLFMLQSTIRR